MKLSNAAWQTVEGMTQLLATLGGDKGETRYVGGCVRDTLLGLPVSDVDLATQLVPDEVLKRLKRAHIKAVPTGLAHGTVTAVIGGVPIEVTTLRRDVSTDGRHATIAYTGDWKEDAARRDFTINAFSADPTSLQVYDYFDGEADLGKGRVRFIGDPLTRIAEDHLRILRFFRFHARFGHGEADSQGLAACASRANDLMALSRERIADELLKLLRLPAPAPAIGLMLKLDVLKPVLPEISGAGADRLAELLVREKIGNVEADPLRRLAALLPVDPEVAASVAARLRLSNKATRRLVSAADRKASDEADPRALAYRIGREEAIDRILLGGGDARLVEALALWHRPRLQLGGGDLIAMGLKPGPIVARTLQAIEREWAESGFSGDILEQRQLALRHVAQALRATQ